MDVPLVQLTKKREELIQFFIQRFTDIKDSFGQPTSQQIPIKWLEILQTFVTSWTNLSEIIVELGEIDVPNRPSIELWMDKFLASILLGCSTHLQESIHDQKVNKFVQTIPKMELEE